MTTRFLMNSSLVTAGATLAGLSMLYLRHRVKFPALLAWLVCGLGYRAFEITQGMTPGQAMVREGIYAYLGGLVALDAWRRSDGPGRWVALEVGGLGLVSLGGLGWLAMELPGQHPDYRGLIPVALGAALCCILAGWEASRKLDQTACWGLGAVFLSQATIYLGWEFGIDYATLATWLHMVVYLWVMLEITLATGETQAYR